MGLFLRRLLLFSIATAISLVIAEVAWRLLRSPVLGPLNNPTYCRCEACEKVIRESLPKAPPPDVAGSAAAVSPVVVDQGVGRTVVSQLRRPLGLQLRNDPLGEHLAQLHSPLVEGVDPPDRPLPTTRAGDAPLLLPLRGRPATGALPNHGWPGSARPRTGGSSSAPSSRRAGKCPGPRGTSPCRGRRRRWRAGTGSSACALESGQPGRLRGNRPASP